MSTINPIKALEGLQYLMKIDLGSSYNVQIKNAVDVLEMFVDDLGAPGKPGTSERLIVMGALREVLRARKLFPGSNLNLLALGEEYGELVKACMDEDHGAIYKEGIQTIAMVVRVLTEGDPSTDDFRIRKGLAPIVTLATEAGKGFQRLTFDDHDRAELLVSELLAQTNTRDIRIYIQHNEAGDPTWEVSWIEV